MAPRPQDLLRRSIAEAGWSDDPAEELPESAVGDDVIRTTVLAALARKGSLSIPQITAALADGSSRVRSRALRLMVDRWDAELAAAVDLGRLLDDDDPVVLETACFAVGECAAPDVEIVGTLADIVTGHDDPLVRESGVAALGSIIGRLDDGSGPVVAVARDAVIHACHDRATVRRRAVLALAAFDDPRADAELRRLAADVDWQVRQGAEDLLDVTGDGAPPLVRPARP